jgi:hypothetical protein
MTQIYTQCNYSSKRKMRKNFSGPRPETLAMIRQFARMYDIGKDHSQKEKSAILMN